MVSPVVTKAGSFGDASGLIESARLFSIASKAADHAVFPEPSLRINQATIDHDWCAISLDPPTVSQINNQVPMDR